jgi:CAAX amino terminal protease family.
MFPDGIGLLFNNCVDTVCYYASRTKTLLVNNAGVITAFALGQYFFPQASAAAFGGVIASRSATWITRKVDERYHVHVADIHDWILEQLPGSVAACYPRVVRTLATPSRAVARYAGDPGRSFYFVNDNFVTELFAPVYEELAYRYVGQELLARMLMAIGVPGLAAVGISVAVSDTLFAASHNPDPRDGHFRDTIISGAVFGAMMHYHGLPAAMLAHSYHNATIRFQEELL